TFDCFDPGNVTPLFSCSVEQIFSAHVALQETLNLTKSLGLFKIPIAEGTTSVVITLPPIPEDAFKLTLVLVLRGTRDITVDCPFVFEEGFDLKEGYSVGFDTVNGFFASQAEDPVTHNIVAPVASGSASVVTLGKGDVKFSVGPDVTLETKIGV